MQIFFTVKGNIQEYIKMGRSYPFPVPPLRRCHNKKCNKIVQYKKHGFYERHFITSFFSNKIIIRRYICPLCGHTISYLPSFCLPRFVYALEHIATSIHKSFFCKSSLKKCLEELMDKNDGFIISRQLLYHYKKRFVDNLKLIQIGFRQMNPTVELPDENLSEIERAKKLLVLIKDAPDRVHTFSQKFYEITNKPYLALCK